MNGTQRRLASVVVVVTPKTSLVVTENIQAPLDIDGLMFNDICGTLNSVVGEIAQISFINRLEGQASGTKSGSQSCPLSFGEYFIASNMMEPKEDGFYYNAHGIKHIIIPSMGDPNHLVVYHECATIAENPWYIVQQVDAIHLPSIVKVFDTPTSFLADMNLRILFESMECISETQDIIPS